MLKECDEHISSTFRRQIFHPRLAKDARVSEWRERNSLNASGQFEQNPDSPEAFVFQRATDLYIIICTFTSSARVHAMHSAVVHLVFELVAELVGS